MLHRLARPFSIPAEEERRTFLLFFMYLLFFIGLRWGDSAGRTLFQLSWGDLLSVIFLISAPLAFVAGLTYGYFAGRLSNERLLLIILSLLVAWLASVQILFIAHIGLGPQGFTYLYFFLGTLVAADVVALHLLNYLNDFYDTRSAKQALPFILSASIAGSVVAGFSAPLLNDLIGLEFMPLAWAACLFGIIGLVFVVRRETPPELAQIERQRQSQHLGSNLLQEFRTDAHLLGRQNILRWLAISTLVLVLLMKLLTIQSASVFNVLYADNPKALFNVYNVLDAVFSLLGLLFASLVFNRLIVRYGVGSMSLVFPVLTAVIVTGINFLPQLGLTVASLAYLDDRAFKKVFRNPIEAMFYNSVPINIKARARAFINSITLPLGTLLAGALGLAMAKGGLITSLAGALLSLMLALFYLGVSWLVKNAYSRAMIQLVANDELAIFRAGYAEQEETDPLLIRHLTDRLRRGGDDDGTTLILAEMLYDFQGRKALPDLATLAEQRPGCVRASLISLLHDWGEEPLVRQMCWRGLDDHDVAVRRASAAVLAAVPQAAQDQALIKRFLTVVAQPDEATQASVLPILIASHDPQGTAAAMPLLSRWLTDERHPRRRALGLQVLARSGEANLLAQLTPYLHDEAPIVRVQAVEVIGALAVHTDQLALRRSIFEALREGLTDEEIAVRLAVIDRLAVLNRLPHKPTRLAAARLLLIAMRDARFRVRRAACDALHAYPRREVEQAYHSPDERLAECALYVLAHVGSQQVGGSLVRKRLIDRCETLAGQWYVVQTYRQALAPSRAPSVALLSGMLNEQAKRLLKRIFWLLSALYGEAEVSTVRRSLRSANLRVRADAQESLEAISTPRLAELVIPMHTVSDLAAWNTIAHERLGLSVPSAWETVRSVWPIVREDRLRPIESSELLAAVALWAATDVLPATSYSAGLTAQVMGELRDLLSSPMPLWRETAEAALRKLEPSSQDTADKERLMLSLIEKVVFLKQVQFFDDMPAADVRVLAGVSEEAAYEAGQTIITEGEPSDALYVLVSGRVAVQHRRRSEVERTLTELATLGPREYFGEMSVFAEGPSSADVVALIPTQVLRVRRAPLFALLERRPALTMDLFRVLSQRLRQANELLAKRSL